MKNKVISLLFFCLAACGASLGQFATPNHYSLQGGNLHVMYSTAPSPHFTYQDATRTLQFSGQEITTTTTPIGTLVTVRIVMTVDSGSTTYSLVVPKVNLKPGQNARITTVGLTTEHRFSVVPMMNEGQVEISTTGTLSGTASIVP